MALLRRGWGAAESCVLVSGGSVRTGGGREGYSRPREGGAVCGVLDAGVECVVRIMCTCPFPKAVAGVTSDSDRRMLPAIPDRLYCVLAGEGVEYDTRRLIRRQLSARSKARKMERCARATGGSAHTIWVAAGG